MSYSSHLKSNVAAARSTTARRLYRLDNIGDERTSSRERDATMSPDAGTSSSRLNPENTDARERPFDKLGSVPPFRLDLTVWALRRRARNAIDRWDNGLYQRVVVLGGTAEVQCRCVVLGQAVNAAMMRAD